MQRQNLTDLPPQLSGQPAEWQDNIKADLDTRAAKGRQFYGIREDGEYIARTKDVDKIIRRPSQQLD